MVSSKFTSKTNPVKSEKKGEKSTDRLASIEKLSLLIPAKSSKEVNKISKYFKLTKSTQDNKSERKLYAQTSKHNISNTKEVLKIKEIFPNLKVDKIENIQKIIKNFNKFKPKLNMIIKGPFKKQVIVPMSNENKSKFMEDNSDHVANINRLSTDHCKVSNQMSKLT